MQQLLKIQKQPVLSTVYSCGELLNRWRKVSILLHMIFSTYMYIQSCCVSKLLPPELISSWCDNGCFRNNNKHGMYWHQLSQIFHYNLQYILQREAFPRHYKFLQHQVNPKKRGKEFQHSCATKCNAVLKIQWHHYVWCIINLELTDSMKTTIRENYAQGEKLHTIVELIIR